MQHLRLAHRVIPIAIACLALPLAANETITLRGAQTYGAPVEPARVSVDMRNLPAYPQWQPGDPIKEVPQRKGLPKDFVAPETAPQPDRIGALRQWSQRAGQLSGGPAFDTPLINRDGSGFSGVNPPDTVGDVGNEYFIQMINGSSTRVLILDKTDGSTVADFALGTLAAGSGTGCASGAGDPIVMFDQNVDNGPGQPKGRWFLSEFTFSSFCVYISETADPIIGDWFIYEFGSISGGLPDYPKWAVWPDAYYIGANEGFGGGRANYAFDRENMLQGNAARPAQVFATPTLAGFGFQMAQPVDWDGLLPPPPGAPGLFVRHRDDEAHNAGSNDPSQDFLEIWEFSVDWDTPGNSTFSGPTNIGVAEFESELCGLFAFACVPQPGSGTQLDPLREPVMWRAQYRNFGAHQAIVGSWVTDVVGGAADVHGVQWLELRNTGAAWLLHQEGLVSPDNVNRWMSAIAMDGDGNIALGYNVSDATSVSPGLRYSGRLSSDPAGTMPRGENLLVAGSAANASNRYGDYSAMVVDPNDECTFWFTGEYNTSSQWSTRIGAMRFVACGDPGFILNPATPVGAVCTAAAAEDFVTGLDVLSVNSFVEPVTLSFDPALPAGFSGGFSINPVVPGNSTDTTVTVDQAAAPGDYLLTIVGTASGAEDRSTELFLNVTNALPAAPQLTSPANGAGNVLTSTELVWSAVDQASNYHVEVATDSAFNTIVRTADVVGTNYTIAPPLNTSTEYYWRVTADNSCGDGAASPVFSFTTQPAPGDCPIGTDARVLFEDDMETGAAGWVISGEGSNNTWQLTDAIPGSSGFAFNAENLATISDQRLISPAVQLPGAEQLPITLRFSNDQEIEDSGGTACWDGAVLEISTNGGVDWTELSGDRILFREHDGTINNFSGGPNPLAGSPAWCGDPRAWEDYQVDLSDFVGEEIQLRFRFGTDGTVGNRRGWSIDDVRVESCREAGPLIFSDRFEQATPPR